MSGDEKTNETQLSKKLLGLIELEKRHSLTGTAILNAPEVVVSRWGKDHQCLWPHGEPFLLCGPDSVGKTTIAQQLVLGMIGVSDPELLGFPITPSDRVLYIAADRPLQALCSFRRMVTEDHRDLLDKRLAIWSGALPVDVLTNPKILLHMARYHECDVVVIDSLKDIVGSIDTNDGGQAVQEALQLLVAEGIDPLALHHQRKQSNGGPKPCKIQDVYGSRWITAGSGSIFMLWGEAGDVELELIHIKPADELLPILHVEHDYPIGRTKVVAQIDAYEVLQQLGGAMTAKEYAEFRYDDTKPSTVEKARRELNNLVKRGWADVVTNAKGKKLNPTQYRLVKKSARAA